MDQLGAVDVRSKRHLRPGDGSTGACPASAGAAAVIGTYALQGWRTDDIIANSAALTAFFAVARLFASQIRTSAVRLEQARSEAVREGRALAEARERSVQLRLLHDHALQTLETIAGGRFRDLESVRAQARTEADQLERELNRVRSGPRTFAERLATICEAHLTEGLQVAVECPNGLIVEGPLADAFCGATNEALTNTRKHARTDEARIHVLTTSDSVVVTIVDAGAGFDRSVAGRGFGMNESIHRRMHDAGGQAHVESALGDGTRVTLTGPRWSP